MTVIESALDTRAEAFRRNEVAMRALVAEQVYRAQQILAGHPYHRS